jgi:hypothetical protein
MSVSWTGVIQCCGSGSVKRFQMEGGVVTIVVALRHSSPLEGQGAPAGECRCKVWRVQTEQQRCGEAARERLPCMVCRAVGLNLWAMVDSPTSRCFMAESSLPLGVWLHGPWAAIRVATR